MAANYSTFHSKYMFRVQFRQPTANRRLQTFDNTLFIVITSYELQANMGDVEQNHLYINTVQ